MSKLKQRIFYGPPGTGKSKCIQDQLADIPQEAIFRTLFHSEYDYADFFGSYKAVSVKVEGRFEVRYQFVPGVFLRAYVHAYKTGEPTYLIIEEMNRGNCAAIFGEVFQLLDRGAFGQSQYEIDISEDVRGYLTEEGVDSDTLSLPPSFYIYATLNTSDQSIFPMDSAFKRRWDWAYVPINYQDAHHLGLRLHNEWFSWSDFIEKMNHQIYKISESEDKQIGNRFVNPRDGIIDADTFVNKILFYLWNDVFKQEDLESQYNVFKYENAHGDIVPFKFTDLFQSVGEINGSLLQAFMHYNGIQSLSKETVEQFLSNHQSTTKTKMAFYNVLLHYLNEHQPQLLDNHYFISEEKGFYLRTNVEGMGYYFSLNSFGKLSLRLAFESKNKMDNKDQFTKCGRMLLNQKLKAVRFKEEEQAYYIIADCYEANDEKKATWAMNTLAKIKSIVKSN